MGMASGFVGSVVEQVELVRIGKLLAAPGGGRSLGAWLVEIEVVRVVIRRGGRLFRRRKLALAFLAETSFQ
jgi:hypothetical protein